MTRSYLLERKSYYEKLRLSLESHDFSEEIELELAEARKKIEEKYEQERAEDLKKVDHYLELLNDLVEEATKEDVIDNQQLLIH